MKIALCFAGHMRTYEYTYEMFKKYIINEINPDIFIHTWDDIEYDGPNNKILHGIKTIDSIGKIARMYRPIAYAIDGYKHFNTSAYINNVECNNGIGNMLSMWYSVFMSNQMKIQHEKDNGFKYDVVIRCRPDVFFYNAIDKNELRINDILWMPNFDKWGHQNDQFAFSSSNNMDIYCNLFNDIDKYYRNGCMLHTETLLENHINENNLPYHMSNIKFKLYRLED